MKVFQKLGGLALAMTIGLGLVMVPAAFAGSSSVAHSVTVSVPSTIQITADTTNFTLTMADYVSGSVSDTKSVVYTIRSNNNALADNANMVTAKLGTAFSGVSLAADPGSYTKTAGNFSLGEVSAGDITIGTTDTNLMKKVSATGNKKTTRGTFPVVYKAIAIADLASGNQVQTLTLTAVDA